MGTALSPSGVQLNGTPSVGASGFNDPVVLTPNATLVGVADFNNDGSPDLVIVNTSRLQFVGDYGGLLQSGPTASWTGTYGGSAVGDFNGDGKADFAITDSSTGRLDVWLGNGDGTFRQQYSVNGAGALAGAADFNGDGKLDLATLNGVLPGNGDGTFRSLVSYPAASSTVNPSTFGQNIIFTASVSPSSASGTVVFKDGTTPVANITVIGGSASWSTSTLSVGSHPLTAVYGGDANDSGSTSPVLNQTVVQGATTVTLTSSANPSAFGQSVTFTASISPAAATGTVTFKDGSATLGSSQLAGGIAVLTTATLPIGAHSITAAYSGDANAAGATSSVLTQTINQATTTIALTSSANPSTYGQSVTLTATLSPAAATGTVTFKDGSATLGSGTLSNGIATLAVGTFAVGSHQLTAVYAGDANDAGATSPVLTLAVNQAATSIQASVGGQAVFGQTVVIQAAVTPATATGTVTFKDGLAAIGTVALSAGGASLAISTLAVGPHSLTAVYSGDANYLGSSSSPVSEAVGASAFAISGGITLSGTGLSGVTVALSGSGSASAITDNSGNYTFAGLASGGSYTVTPTLAGYTFNPASRTFSNLSSDQTAAFTASAVPTVVISGQVTSSGSPVVGVAITVTGTQPASATTNPSGSYSVTLPQGGTYTVSAALTGYVFTAPVTFSNITSNQTASFTGTKMQNQVARALLRDTHGAIQMVTYPSGALSYAGGVFASDPSAAEDANGNVFVTARDTFNSIWVNVYRPVTSAWGGWNSGGGIIQGMPSLAVDTTGKAWIATRDNFNSYWLVNYTNGAGFGAWMPLLGIFSTDPVITSCGDGSVYLIGKDTFNSLWSGRYIPGTGFQGWQFGGGIIKGKPSATCGSDNAVYIVAEDNWNSNWMARVSGNNWTGWYYGGAITSVTPRITSLGNGNEAVVILDAGGVAWQATFTEGTGNGWQQWSSTGGVLEDAAPAGMNGQFYLAGKAPNGDLWWWLQTGNQWTWIGDNGMAAGSLAATPW